MLTKLKSTKARKLLYGICFAAIGAAAALYGTSFKGEDRFPARMLLMIPGIATIADTFFFLLYERFRSKTSFLFTNFLLYIAGCFLLECIYFQFIVYGLSQPQYKLMVPALVFALLHAVPVTILAALYSFFTGAKTKTSEPPKKKGRRKKKRADWDVYH